MESDSSMPQPTVIHVIRISGEKLITMVVDSDVIVAALRARIDEKLELGQACQGLLFNELLLEDALTVESSQLQDGSTVSAVIGAQTPEVFHTHDNGGRPFQVEILQRNFSSGWKGTVSVFKRKKEEGEESSSEEEEEGNEEADGADGAQGAAEEEESEQNEEDEEEQEEEEAEHEGEEEEDEEDGGEAKEDVPSEVMPSFDTSTPVFKDDSPERIFIGKSPLNGMTKFSGGHGPEFDGNSILVKQSSGLYVYIGENISSFLPMAEIVDYISPVGNNDVPYPFAVDVSGNFYLLLENVVIRNLPDKAKDDPYCHYYESDRKKQRISAKTAPLKVEPLELKLLVKRQI